MTLLTLPSIPDMLKFTVVMWSRILFADCSGDVDLTLLRFGPVSPPALFPSKLFVGFPAVDGTQTLEFVGTGPIDPTFHIQSSVTLNAIGKPYQLNQWNQIFFSCDLDITNPNYPVFDFVVNGASVTGANSNLFAPDRVTGGKLGISTTPEWLVVATAVNPKMDMSLCQVWFDLRIDPSVVNLAKIYEIRNGFVCPVGGDVAATAFGVPDIWLERDSISDVKFEENQGTAGVFTVDGTLPTDFSLSPSDDPPPVA